MRYKIAHPFSFLIPHFSFLIPYFTLHNSYLQKHILNRLQKPFKINQQRVSFNTGGK